MAISFESALFVLFFVFVLSGMVTGVIYGVAQVRTEKILLPPDGISIFETLARIVWVATPFILLVVCHVTMKKSVEDLLIPTPVIIGWFLGYYAVAYFICKMVYWRLRATDEEIASWMKAIDGL